MVSELSLRCVRVLAVPLLLVGSVWQFSAAADWPGWRGAKRDGTVDDFHAPASWPAELEEVWKVELGEGHSAPVVVGQQIFQFTRLDDQETVSCLDMEGNLVWRQQYPAPYEVNPAARNHGKGPKSTPLVAGGNVYTLGISGILSCWSADRGQRRWQHKFAGQYEKTSPLFGTAMSPLAAGQVVLAHVGGHDSGAFCAFEARSGQVQWSWNDEGPAYTSPIVAKVGGLEHLITQSQKHCIGLSHSGELLWSIPYETQYVMNIVTPVVYKDVVIFSGYNRGVTAYRLENRGGKLAAQEAWHKDDVSMFMNSPVLVRDRLYGFSQHKKGQLFCLDAATGKLIWAGPARQGENASLLAAGGTLMALTTEAELIVFQSRGNDYEETVRYKVAESPTWAHLVTVGQRFLVKDADKLAMWTTGP